MTGDLTPESEGPGAAGRWDKIQRLFKAARAATGAKRDRLLEAAALEDPELVAEVRRLLDVSPPDSFLQQKPIGSPEELFAVGIVGQHFGRYVLVREIGRGGMGVIYLAKREGAEKEVALKILPRARGDEEGRARFDREIAAASSLHHPAIVRVLEFGEQDGLAWYAMPFVEGHDLSVELVRQRALNEGRAADATLLPLFTDALYLPTVAARVADLADGLQAAHDASVVHRDIKPQNILLDQRGQASVTDFGLAKDARFGTLTATSAIQGTPNYMSPEQARALKRTVDHRTDVYSLSVVLFEALTLQRAFNGQTFHEVVDQIGRGATTDVRRHNERIPRDLALICRKGMSRDPGDRYASAREMAEDLRRFLRHEAVRAKPPTTMEIVKRWLRLHGTATLAGAAVVVALLIGAAVASWRAERVRADHLAAELEAAVVLEDWDGATTRIASLRRALDQRGDEGVSPYQRLRSEATRFEARLAGYRNASLSRAKQLIDAGIGGGDGGVEFAPYAAPPSPRLLGEGLALAQRLSLVLPEDSEVSALASIESTFPRLDVEAVVVADDGSTRAAADGEAEVWIAAVDPYHDTIGPERRLGTAPVSAVPVPPGDYRIRVRVGEFGYADLFRSLGSSTRQARARARVHRRARLVESMVKFGAGPIRLGDDRILGCLLLDDSADLEEFHLDAAELSNREYLEYLRASGSEAPPIWKSIGFDGDWRSMPVDEVGDAWLDRPVTGVMAAEAQACAEWYGKRLPRHLELELALSFVEPALRLPDAAGSEPAANIGGTERSGAMSTDHPALYRHYLQNTLAVRDPRCLQADGRLFHAQGNLTEMTSSIFVEAVAARLEVRRDERIALGQNWTCKATERGPRSHWRAFTSSRYIDMTLGVRLAF